MFYVVIQDLIKNEITSEMMEPHRSYIKELINQKKMVVAGPFTDRRGGMILIEADNENEAYKIAANDPAVKSGILQNNIREFDMAFLREKTKN